MTETESTADRRFQFTLSDLLFTVTWIAIGLAGVKYTLSYPVLDFDERAPYYAMSYRLYTNNPVIWLVSTSLVGAGFGALFRKEQRGVWIGFILGLLLFALNWISMCDDTFKP